MVRINIEINVTAVIGVLAVNVLSAAQLESYTPPPFSQYEPIIERMPFGDLPDDFGLSVDPNAAKLDALLKVEQQKLAQKINMSAVNITPQGNTAIGFTDLSARPPVNYYLLVGDESGGWKVNSANYEEETAEIERDGIAISLKLGKGLVEKSAVAPPSTSSSHSRTSHSIRSALAKSNRTVTLKKPANSSASIRSSSTSATANEIRDKLRNSRSSNNSSAIRSYTDRLRERKIQEFQAMKLAKDKELQQLEKLAREVASKEIKKQAAVIADEAKLEKAIALENEQFEAEKNIQETNNTQ